MVARMNRPWLLEGVTIETNGFRIGSQTKPPATNSAIGAKPAEALRAPVLPAKPGRCSRGYIPQSHLNIGYRGAERRSSPLEPFLGQRRCTLQVLPTGYLVVAWLAGTDLK